MKKFANMMLNAASSKMAERLCLALVLGAYTGAAMADELSFITAPLCGFANVFKGPLALAVATIAFFGAGAAALWGEEIAGISKKMVNIIMAVTIMMGGSFIVSYIANKIGATASCT
jgi:type IV secretory pathway VirB2 component (pilin)